jgi:hypothetical protein
MTILSEFVFGALTGVAGNAIYAQVTNILGSRLHPKLTDAATNNDMEKFLTILDAAMDANEEIKLKLENLQAGKTINLNQMKNVFGDNFIGNKTINNN